MEPMKGKWASSRVDLGYTELFSIFDVTAVLSRLVTAVLGTLWCSMRHIEAPFMFDWEHGIALHPMQGFMPHLPPSGMSHGISRVDAGTWGIFSNYSVDGHSKLDFVQRSQGSCLVRTDTSGI